MLVKGIQRFQVLLLLVAVKERLAMNVRLPAPCVQIHVPLVLENPSTGTRCIELANGDPALSKVCMCRIHLSEDEEMLDVPLYVMSSDNEQALLGMDILSLGNFSAEHTTDNSGKQWLRFRFSLIDQEWLV